MLDIEMLQIVTDNFTQEKREKNFRKNRDWRIHSVNTLFVGSESTSYDIPKNWEIAPVKKKKDFYKQVLKK